jgi:hypothetical protein
VLINKIEGRYIWESNAISLRTTGESKIDFTRGATFSWTFQKE